jgi:dolichol-phosphate mannosyltransferase
MMDMFTLGVSVVTTTWNEKENIQKLIQSLRDVMDATPHEIIVVDDNSSDGTFSIAKRLADVAVVKKREGQTKRLLHGMQLAKYPVIITIDSDLENDPKHIPALIKQMIKYQFDVVVASRTHLPQISEIVTSKTLGRLV